MSFGSRGLLSRTMLSRLANSKMTCPRVSCRTYFDDDDDDLLAMDANVLALNQELKWKILGKQYSEAVKMWGDHRKTVDIPTVSTYEIMLRLCKSINSESAMEAVREDMASVGVMMNVSCGLMYAWNLLSMGEMDKVLSFVQQDLSLKGDGIFISKCAAMCLYSDHTSLSMHVCQEFTGTGISPDHDVRVKCIHSRILASKGQHNEAMEMLNEDCSNTVMETFTRADILATSGRIGDCLSILESMVMSECDHQLDCLGNLSQCVRDTSDLGVVARTHTVVQRYLEQHQPLSNRDIEVFAEIKRAHLTKLLNNMMYLQGRLKHKAYNYFEHFRNNSLEPDVDTYTAVALLLMNDCNMTGRKVDMIVRKMIKLKVKMHGSDLVKFLDHCDTVSPSLIYKSYPELESPLMSQHFKVLLRIKYMVDVDSESQLMAAKCVRRIIQMMKQRDLLVTTEAVNDALQAYVDIGNIGAIFTFYQDINRTPVSPDIATYHILLNAVLNEQQYHHSACCKAVAIVTTRLRGGLMPDDKLLHKLVQCCRACNEMRLLENIVHVFEDRGLKWLLQEEDSGEPLQCSA